MGSSPRLRGALGALSLSPSKTRIIPALAGSTPLLVIAATFTGDHPRACGEHWNAKPPQNDAGGSSPRLRGARKYMGVTPTPDGIIPALAGSTNKTLAYANAQRDHPRACGEHPLYGRTASRKWGSSPRLRGAPVAPDGTLSREGIIPALAGSTLHPIFERLTLRDHPRACGEHSPKSSPDAAARGSSPRLRGAQLFLRARLTVDGIIPALAGSTNYAMLDNLKIGDHPRACGEHWRSIIFEEVVEGSSPRLRGAPIESRSVSDGVRDHPRACGEHVAVVIYIAPKMGSSPRLRGAPPW